MMDNDHELTEGAIGLLEVLNDARDDLRKTMERWENRLILERLSFAEGYERGQFQIVLVYDFLDEEGLIGDSWSYNMGVAIDQIAMLVEIVQYTQGIERVIPSLIRFHHINQKIDSGTIQSLYFSVLDHRYKFIPRLLNGEIDVPCCSPTTQNNQFAHHIIQCTAQVVSGIPNQHNNVIMRIDDTFDAPHITHVSAGIRIYLTDESVVVRIEPSQQIVKVNDVLIGSFDL